MHQNHYTASTMERRHAPYEPFRTQYAQSFKHHQQSFFVCVARNTQAEPCAGLVILHQQLTPLDPLGAGPVLLVAHWDIPDTVLLLPD